MVTQTFWMISEAVMVRYSFPYVKDVSSLTQARITQSITKLLSTHGYLDVIPFRLSGSKNMLKCTGKFRRASELSLRHLGCSICTLSTRLATARRRRMVSGASVIVPWSGRKFLIHSIRYSICPPDLRSTFAYIISSVPGSRRAALRHNLASNLVGYFTVYYRRTTIRGPVLMMCS